MKPSLLCIGHLAHDLQPLVVIAEEASHTLGLEPVFLITSPDDYFTKAKAHIDATGYRVIQAPTVSNQGAEIQNPLRRFLALRENNRVLARELLKQIQPTAILATVDAARDQFLAEATRLDIPNIFLQVAFWGTRAYYKTWFGDDVAVSERGFSRVRRLKQRAYRQLETFAGIGARPSWERKATRIAVQGPYWKRLLVRNGMPADRVIATGNPGADEAYRLRFGAGDWRTRLYRQVGLEFGAPYFLHCREHFGRLQMLNETVKQDAQLQVLRALRAADPDIPIVVKLHPRERNPERELITRLDPRAIVVDTLPTMELIAASELMVSTVSTTLIWAAAMDRPTFSAYFWDGIEYFRRETEWSGVERVYTPPQLTQAVQRLRRDAEYAALWRNKRAQFTNDQLCFDGRSVERLVALLDELIAR